MCDPVNLGLQVLSAGVQMVGQRKQTQATAAAAEANAAQLDVMAAREFEKAAFETEATEQQFRRAIGETKAAIGASGLTLGSFSDVIADAAQGNQMDKDAIQYGAATRAEQLRFQSTSERLEANSAKSAGRYQMLGTALGAVTSLVKMRPTTSNGVAITTPFQTP